MATFCMTLRFIPSYSASHILLKTDESLNGVNPSELTIFTFSDGRGM